MESVEEKNLNSEKIWKIWKKSQLNSEMIWKIWKKGKLDSGKIWKIKWWQTFVRIVIIEINTLIMKIKWQITSERASS